jgi:hypothetical protein
MWRCPHCGAPQAESARCWVCHRSSTTCSTCRHFQTALSADIGWCALDPKRLPLTGREQRGCWRERPLAAAPPPPDAGVPTGQHFEPAAADEGKERWAAPGIQFIPVEIIGRAASLEAIAAAEPAMTTADEAKMPGATLPLAPQVDDGWTERTSLFGEPEV